jgi:hypothetical protein
MDGTNAVASKHSFVGATDTGSDSGGNWAGATYLNDVLPTARSCVNMCHANHPHAATDVGGNHEYNAYKDPTTSATRNSGTAGNTSAFRSKTDFDGAAATGGMCGGCHQKPVAAGRPAIAAAAYGASAHDYVGTETTPINYAAYGTWEYVQHTGDRFQRNCTKCHANRAEATTPSVNQRSAAAVHNSDGATLLGGTKNPGASPATFICYNCHGSATIGTNRSGKDVYTQVAKAVSHPANTGTVHDTNAEAAATFNDGKFRGTNRHANCADCHDPHEVGPTSHVYATTATSARNLIAAASPLKGVAGVSFNYAALARWTAPAAANFSTNPVTAAREYEVCFKCHSSFAFGATPPNGISANGTATTPVETDVALEFNPANRSGHPIVTGLNNYTNSAAPKALLATQMKAPWNGNVGTQTMMCSDCHNTDAASPAVQGPHGSAAQFMLRGPNQANWPHVAYNSWATSWCANCHNPGSNPGHANSNHNNLFCDTCHVVIPHGANMSRLIADHVRMPSRYAYSNTLIANGLQGFTKTTDTGYVETNCAASCNGVHPVPGSTVERWNN